MFKLLRDIWQPGTPAGLGYPGMNPVAEMAFSQYINAANYLSPQSSFSSSPQLSNTKSQSQSPSEPNTNKSSRDESSVSVEKTDTKSGINLSPNKLSISKMLPELVGMK